MATVRVRQDVAMTVFNTETQSWETLTPGAKYGDDHPFVAMYSTAFESDVEQATAAPGEKRTTTRRK